MRVSSKLGQGTTIDLWLPEAKDLAADEERGLATDGDRKLSIAPLRILLVDDDSLVRIGTAALLEGVRSTSSSRTRPCPA